MELQTSHTEPESPAPQGVPSSLLLSYRQFLKCDEGYRSERRKLMRSVIGKTKKSPFLWSVGQQRFDVDFRQTLQRIHGHFFGTNGGGVGVLADDAIRTDKDFQQELYAVALSAYGFPVRWQADELESSDLLAAPLLSMLRHVELPLWNLTNDGVVEEPASLVLNTMEMLLRESLDGDGWPESRMIADAGLLMASIARSCELLNELDKQIDPEVFFMLTGLHQQLLRMSRSDGSLLLNEVGGGINCNSFAKTIRRRFSDSFLDKLAKKRGLAPGTASSLSEWGQVGVLQKNWKTGCNKVGVAFGEQRVRVEVSNGKTLILGDSTPELLIAGNAVSVKSEIGVSGFLKFDGGEYLELEIEFEGATVQRQILYFRQDDWLLINDVVSCDDAASAREIEYQVNFQFGMGVELVRETENNEFYLKRDDEYTLVLPLAMPEWKSESSIARLSFEQDRLQAIHRCGGNGLAFPVAIDLNKNRSKQPRTWRHLTVAENMKTVSEDVAVAFRIQLGRDQWVIYRSIAKCASRTFLGQNYADEFFVGKIDRNGHVQPVVEIE